MYKQFGWSLNISVSIQNEKEGYRLLNYLTAPTVLIWSAIKASCAIPLVFAPVELKCKTEEGDIVPFLPTSNHKYIDGSIAQDLPMTRISELFNVNSFIVSQVNPQISTFLSNRGGGLVD